MRFGLVIGVGLAAATLACTSDAAGVSDGGTCSISAGPPPSRCPDRGCPQRFTMEAQAVCPSDPGIRQPVTFWTGCAGGLDVIVYMGVDTADDIFFRADGSLLGYGYFTSANFGGSSICVPGVPDGFSFGACAAHSGIACGVPDAGP